MDEVLLMCDLDIWWVLKLVVATCQLLNPVLEKVVSACPTFDPEFKNIRQGKQKALSFDTLYSNHLKQSYHYFGSFYNFDLFLSWEII